MEDRVLLVAAYWRTNLTSRQLAPLFGVSKYAAGRIIDHVGPMLALKSRRRFRRGTVRTRNAALALRGAEQARPARPVVGRRFYAPPTGARRGAAAHPGSCAT